MAYEATVPVHRRLLWSAVTDPERLLGAVPNLVVEASTDQGVAARLRLRVGDRSITFRGIARLVELAPEQLRAVFEVEAVHGRSDGAIDGRVELRLVASGGGTRVLVTPALELSGRAPTISPEQLIEAGQRLIPRWFELLASTAPEPRHGPATLTVVPDTVPERGHEHADGPERGHEPAQQQAQPQQGQTRQTQQQTQTQQPQAPLPEPAVGAATPPPIDPHVPTLTLITGDAEDATPSPKAPLRLVSDADEDPDFEQQAEADLWSRGRGPLLSIPLWVFGAAALGMFGLAGLLLRRLLRRR
jgi:carbon monoxide dehydrogenase subunit G